MLDPLPLEERLKHFLNMIQGTLRYKSELCGASPSWVHKITRGKMSAPTATWSATTRYRLDTDGKYSLIFEDKGDKVSLIWAKVNGHFRTVPEHVGEGDMVTALGQAIDWMGAAHTAGATA